jgi:hypothetical protein
VVNVQDVDHLLVVVDAVPYAVLSATRSVLSLKWRVEGSSDAVRVVGEHTVDELHARRSHKLRQALRKLPCCGGATRTV